MVKNRVQGLLVASVVLIMTLGVVVDSWAATPQRIKIEWLPRVSKRLPELSREELLRRLIVGNIDTLQFEGRYEPKILAHSDLPSKMVNFGYNSLFWGMFEAYAEHRPFALSPDIMWLLISQGFARHVEANSEALRDKFVAFDGDKELVILRNSAPEGAEWGDIVGEFSKLICDNTKGEIAKLLECDFSTTTSAERVASQATILNSMKSYFRYTVIRVVCGIPRVDLYGTEADWREVIRRTEQLAQYDLEWWTSEIIPVLEKIASSAAGEVDKTFWRDMFKYHTEQIYGNPKCVDGWIVKFYPYSQSGHRNDLKETTGHGLPDEVVRVPIKFIDKVTGKSYNLELCAGFFGLEQQRRSQMLTPQIGWYLYVVDEKTILNQNENDFM